MSRNQPWWQEAVVYEVYPRSFADADGDGIGDLAGLRSRLPYLADLGVDAVWLTPFYPSPLADGGYDISDYRDVDPRLGTLAGFDALAADAAAHGIRLIVDIVPNHCSAGHPYFREALAAPPGSSERDMFMFRDGRGERGELPPNNWQSVFHGPAWTRVTEPDGRPGQWYLHLFDESQPDWNWRNPAVARYFEEIIRFWLDRGAAGLRIDVAHGIFKDPDLTDLTDPVAPHAPTAYYHRPELHDLYRSWRTILDSYPAEEFPGSRTAVGEVWYDSPATLMPYLAGSGLPQVFNFQLILARWDAGELRDAIDAVQALADGSRAPWVIGNHDVPRPVSRYAMGVAGVPPVPDIPRASAGLPRAGSTELLAGAQRARAAALLLLALPGSAYLYQGEELGLPEVVELPGEARADPTFRRSGGTVLGRDGCRVPLPWSATGPSFGFSSGNDGAAPSAPWLPQPEYWGRYSVAEQRGDPGSFLNLYRSALRLRRAHPALGYGRPGGSASLTWIAGPDVPPGMLCFSREPGFTFAANLGPGPVPLPPHTDVLLASGPLSDGKLPADTAVWLASQGSWSPDGATAG
ncbi:MAG TPA: glycoside hydrolase family 13 protein [Streptosporangiaceae bacterium]|nr:glycoside hydrolase family 13 protein [Streptosporangiaceae bacterium]